VDYDSSGESGDSSQATDMPFITPRIGILALAVPSTRQEHTTVVITADGSQPKVESTQEELASQNNPPDAADVDADRRRRSTRVSSQGNTSIRIEDKAKTIAEKKDLIGTTLNHLIPLLFLMMMILLLEL
jgi:hypothetical protein